MSYIGQTLPTDVFGGYATDTFAGDGSATTFTLSQAPFNEQGLIVVINNVIQQPTTNYTVSGTTLTIVGTAVASGDVIYARHTGLALPIGEASAVTEGTTIDLNGGSDKLILDADADTTISADTDDQIDFKAGGTDIMSLTATTATFNDGVEITVNDNSNTLKLTSTDADATNGPILRMFRDSSSPADSDETGRIIFSADNDAGEETNFFEMKSSIGDASDGTEDGRLTYNCMVAGTSRNILDITSGNIVFNQDSQDIDFRVESDGNATMFHVDAGRNEVGVGTSNDYSAALVTYQTATDHRSLQVEASTSSYASDVLDIACTRNTNDTTYRFLTMQRRGYVQVFRVTDAGDVDNYNNSYGSLSDQRLKTDITDSSSQWDDIKAIKVKKFKMGFGGDDNTKLGVIAQEVEAAGMTGLVKERDANEYEIKHNSVFGSLYEDGDDIPEGKKVGEIKENKEKVKEVKYSILYMKAIKALQEAMAKIETLETKVKALEDA